MAVKVRIKGETMRTHTTFEYWPVEQAKAIKRWLDKYYPGRYLGSPFEGEILFRDRKDAMHFRLSHDCTVDENVQ